MKIALEKLEKTIQGCREGRTVVDGAEVLAVENLGTPCGFAVREAFIGERQQATAVCPGGLCFTVNIALFNPERFKYYDSSTEEYGVAYKGKPRVTSVEVTRGNPRLKCGVVCEGLLV